MEPDEALFLHFQPSFDPHARLTLRPDSLRMVLAGPGWRDDRPRASRIAVYGDLDPALAEGIFDSEERVALQPEQAKALWTQLHEPLAQLRNYEAGGIVLDGMPVQISLKSASDPWEGRVHSPPVGSPGHALLCLALEAAQARLSKTLILEGIETLRRYL